MTLYDLKNGEKALVISLDDVKIKSRLEKLGFFSGVKVVAVRKALFNGAIQINFRNFSLALRKETAEKIIVKR